MEETISLGEFFKTLKKRLGLIIMSLLIGIALAAGITFFLIKPQYSSSAELIVQSKTNKDTNSNLQADVNANVMLINTYKDMIMGDVVLNTAQKRLAKDDKLDLTKDELKSIIKVEQSENSQMFQIISTTNNPDKAAKITNQVAKVFKEKAKDVLNVNRVTITSKGQSNSNPVSPNNKINIAIGAVIGLLVGIVTALLLEMFDKTVKDERFITDELGLPVIGSIREMTAKEITRGQNYVISRNVGGSSQNVSRTDRTRERV